jgi:hypothetical protein
MPTTLPISYDAGFEPRCVLSDEQWMLIPLCCWAAVMLLVAVSFQPGADGATADVIQLAACF